VGKIKGQGGHAFAVKADVSDPFAVQAMFDEAEAMFSGVDVLINNAGIMKLAKLADSDNALFDQQIAINLKGSFNAMREAAKRIRDGGRIVNFSTSVVGTKRETYRVYVATMAAGGNHDRGAGEGVARPQRHRECRGAGVGRNRVIPDRQIAGADRSNGQDEWSGSEHRRISPPSWLFSPVLMAGGSMARCCVPMAAWFDQDPRSHASISALISRG
jgi:NAD(P)-dependent dehydrogenase (short-subunit alcohol dehydrogenase family)